MTGFLWLAGAVAVCAAMLWAASRIEPHWVAKDRSRFLTTSETMDASGHVVGRRREVRGTLLADGSITLSRRSITRTRSARWRIRGKSPQPPRGREVYLLVSVPPEPGGEMLALRVPRTSPLVAVLDARTPHGADVAAAPVVSAPPPDRGTRRWGRRSGRG